MLEVRSFKFESKKFQRDKFLTLDNLNSKAQIRQQTFHEPNLVRSYEMCLTVNSDDTGSYTHCTEMFRTEDGDRSNGQRKSNEPMRI